MLALLLYLAAANAQTFEAYDCEHPDNVRMLPHESCRVNPSETTEQSFVIAQLKNRRNTTGVSCEVHITTQIDYCGHSSVTKGTDQSSYYVPKLVSVDQCKMMADTLVYEAAGNKFDLRMDSTNIISYFTHGSVTYSTTNVACVGESIRLSTGNVIKNMLRQEKLHIKLQKVDLIVEDDEVLMRTGEVIGRYAVGGGISNLITTTWDNTYMQTCNLAAITMMPMTTSDNKIFVNTRHMVKITRTTSGYHAACKVMIQTITSYNS